MELSYLVHWNLLHGKVSCCIAWGILILFGSSQGPKLSDNGHFCEKFLEKCRIMNGEEKGVEEMHLNKTGRYKLNNKIE
jgi:hypothetical protein